MKNKIVYRKLGEFVKLKQGLAINAQSAHLVSETKQGKFLLPLLRIADMMDGTYKKYISIDVNKSVIANKDDIIYTRTGQIGLVFTGYNGVVHNNSFIVELNSSELNKEYLLTILSTDYVRNQALNFAKNSVQPDLTHDMFKEIIIPVFRKDVQKAITRVYSQINNKINLNNKINDNLSKQAELLFLHNFYNKAPNGILNDIIIENEKSKIQVNQAKGIIGEYPFFTSGANILKYNNYFVDGLNCFLNTGGNADIKIYYGKAAYSTDTWCICTKNNMTSYLYLLLFTAKDELYKKYFKGTGLKHLQKPMLKLKNIYIPSNNEISKFNSYVDKNYTQISQNIRENAKLVQLRDFILPLLINGQATIS